MNTREIASEYRLTHWAGILGERSSSGLSIKEFCSASGIRENVYYYWQRKLRQAACEELAVSTVQDSTNRETSLVPNGWAICKTAEPATKGNPLVIEINGCRVYVESDADPEQLKTICRTLKSLC